MKIAIDLQGAQTGSSFRGIGRHGISFAKSLKKHAPPDYEIVILLSSQMDSAIGKIRASLEGAYAPEEILIWTSPTHSDREVDFETSSLARRLLREDFLARHQIDVVIAQSPFEFEEEGATTDWSPGPKDFLRLSILHDLIPALYPNEYLTSRRLKTWYKEKIDSLKSSDLILAISGHAKTEGEVVLGKSAGEIVEIGSAADEFFKTNLVVLPAAEISKKYGIGGNYFLYSGGLDKRKNLKNLIRALAHEELLQANKFQLVLAGKHSNIDLEPLKTEMRALGLPSKALVTTGFVSDVELYSLYKHCFAFVFPSWHEGFGLPVLEAMHAGAAVIASNSTSLPEVIGRADALFDPLNVNSIRSKLLELVTGESFRESLKSDAALRAEKHSWDSVSKKTLKAIEALVNERRQFGPKTDMSENVDSLRALKDIGHALTANQKGEISFSIKLNTPSNRPTKTIVDISELFTANSAIRESQVSEKLRELSLSVWAKGNDVELVWTELDSLKLFSVSNDFKKTNIEVPYFVSDSFALLRIKEKSVPKLYHWLKNAGAGVYFL